MSVNGLWEGGGAEGHPLSSYYYLLKRKTILWIRIFLISASRTRFMKRIRIRIREQKYRGK